MSERHKLTIGTGTDYEKVLYIESPKGRKAREKMPKVLAFAAKLQGLRSDERSDLETILQMVDTFWGMSEFENELVPYVLGLDTEDGKKYLDENCTMVEVIDAFNEAAGFLIERSFNRVEVQEALGKSENEAQKEAPKKVRSSNTAPLD